MKKLLVIVCTFLMFTGMLQAQDKTREKEEAKSSVKKQDRAHMEDHFMFQAGKLYQMKKGMKTEVKTAVTLKNGLIVNPDGSYMMKSEERKQLKNGECLDMAGNHYLNQTMFNKRQMNHSGMQKKKNMKMMPSKEKKHMPEKEDEKEKH